MWVEVNTKVIVCSLPPKTETGIERMTIMTQTTDGFELSERDLEMRGPGDFFGVKQSGLPDFLVANIVEDYRMLEVARDSGPTHTNRSILPK